MTILTDFLKKWGATMGKSCWDCIHCDVCANIDGFSHHVSDVSKCKHFKDKADVEPVKHGKWISMLVKRPDWKGNMQSYYQPNTCSECRVGLAEKTNYCPNCGAKMDGESDD